MIDGRRRFKTIKFRRYQTSRTHLTNSEKLDYIYCILRLELYEQCMTIIEKLALILFSH